MVELLKKWWARIMDEYLFRHFLDQTREVSEKTGYLEMLNYSVRGRPLDTPEPLN